jgi:hypothetical protein
MEKEIDLRDFSRSRLTDSRKTDLMQIAQSVSNEKLGGQHKIRIEKFDATTGNIDLADLLPTKNFSGLLPHT